MTASQLYKGIHFRRFGYKKLISNNNFDKWCCEWRAYWTALLPSHMGCCLNKNEVLSDTWTWTCDVCDSTIASELSGCVCGRLRPDFRLPLFTIDCDKIRRTKGTRLATFLSAIPTVICNIIWEYSPFYADIAVGICVDCKQTLVCGKDEQAYLYFYGLKIKSCAKCQPLWKP